MSFLFSFLAAEMLQFLAGALAPGDTLHLGPVSEPLYLENIQGTESDPVVISGNGSRIDATGFPAGVFLNNCSHVHIEDLCISGNGGGMQGWAPPRMRCGVLVLATQPGTFSGFDFQRIQVDGMYYEDPGFLRASAETFTENGMGNYGYGIRFFIADPEAIFEDIRIENCRITKTSHTGIRLSGEKGHMRNISICNNDVSYTGGPGIQMSCVDDALCKGNTISHSGDGGDSRNWHRGSGMWCWNSRNVLIERNTFSYAQGPGDSAGVHIDFNCEDVCVQYNLSSFNAGGFCQILGNCRRCSYQHNVSYNDGYRKKGVNGAFMDGPLIHISGYVGNKKKRTGPFDCTVSHNVIIVDKDQYSSVAIDKNADGIVIEDNIFLVDKKIHIPVSPFYLEEDADASVAKAMHIVIRNNQFSDPGNWPYKYLIQ